MTDNDPPAAGPDRLVNFDAPAILRKWPSLNNQRRPMARPVFAARIFSAKRTEADYQAWRDHRDWTARNMPCGSVARSFRQVAAQ